MVEKDVLGVVTSQNIAFTEFKEATTLKLHTSGR